MPTQYHETALQRLVTLLALAHAKHIAREKSTRNRFPNPPACPDLDAEDAPFSVFSSRTDNALHQQQKTQG